MQEKRADVGFVGLGNMGQPIAQRLLQTTLSEMKLRVFDQRADRMAPLVTQGAYRAAVLEEVARPGGIVFTMVATDEELLRITEGKGGLLQQLGKGGIHVSLSTVDAEVSTRLAGLYRQQGSAYIAATVLGRPDVAEQGNLSIFEAGDPAAKARVSPLLAAMGKKIYDLGECVKAANIAKIAYNFLIAAAIEAMGEAAALVDAHGLDRARFFQMLIESPLFGGTVYEQYGAQMIGLRDFSDNRFPVLLGLKDVLLALKAGKEGNVGLPIAILASGHLMAAHAAGRGQEDWSAFSDFAGDPASQILVPEIEKMLRQPSSRKEPS